MSHDCKLMRRKLVTLGTMTLGETGGIKNTSQEWRDEPCGTPIFGNNKDQTVCNSCLGGWTHENNFALDTEDNRKLYEENLPYKPGPISPFERAIADQIERDNKEIAIITPYVRIFQGVCKVNALNPSDCFHINNREASRALRPSSYCISQGANEIKDLDEIIEYFEARGATRNTNLKQY